MLSQLMEGLRTTNQVVWIQNIMRIMHIKHTMHIMHIMHIMHMMHIMHIMHMSPNSAWTFSDGWTTCILHSLTGKGLCKIKISFIFLHISAHSSLILTHPHSLIHLIIISSHCFHFIRMPHLSLLLHLGGFKVHPLPKLVWKQVLGLSKLKYFLFCFVLVQHQNAPYFFFESTGKQFSTHHTLTIVRGKLSKHDF